MTLCRREAVVLLNSDYGTLHASPFHLVISSDTNEWTYINGHLYMSYK